MITRSVVPSTLLLVMCLLLGCSALPSETNEGGTSGAVRAATPPGPRLVLAMTSLQGTQNGWAHHADYLKIISPGKWAGDWLDKTDRRWRYLTRLSAGPALIHTAEGVDYQGTIVVGSCDDDPLRGYAESDHPNEIALPGRIPPDLPVRGRAAWSSYSKETQYQCIRLMYSAAIAATPVSAEVPQFGHIDLSVSYSDPQQEAPPDTKSLGDTVPLTGGLEITLVGVEASSDTVTVRWHVRNTDLYRPASAGAYCITMLDAKGYLHELQCDNELSLGPGVEVDAEAQGHGLWPATGRSAFIVLSTEGGEELYQVAMP